MYCRLRRRGVLPREAEYHTYIRYVNSLSDWGSGAVDSGNSSTSNVNCPTLGVMWALDGRCQLPLYREHESIIYGIFKSRSSTSKYHDTDRKALDMAERQ